MATTYNIALVVSGTDRGATGLLNRIGQGLSGVAQIAGGILSAGLLAGIARDIMGIGSSAIQQAGNLQTFTIALETLTAREIARAAAITHTDTVFREASLNEQVQRARLMGQIEEQTALYNRLKDTQADSSLEVQKAALDLKNLQDQYQALGFSQEGVIASTVTWTEQTMTMSDALGAAKTRARELFEEIRALGLRSPYEFATVSDMFRQMLVFTGDSSLSVGLTEGLLDTSAAMGLTSEQTNRLAYNFGQILSVGKIMAVDLRQLSMLGFDLADVFENKLGMSIEQVNAALANGTLQTEDLARAFMEYADENFGGAAQRMSRTLQGLMSSFKDLFTFASADLLGPALNRVGEFLGRIFDTLTRMLEDGTIAEWGQSFFDWLDPILDKVERIGEALGWLDPQLDENRSYTGSIADRPAPQRNMLDMGMNALGIPQDVQLSIFAFLESLNSLKLWWDTNSPPIIAAIASVGSAIAEAFGLDGLAEGMGEVSLSGIIQGLADAIMSFGDWLATNKDGIIEFFTGISDWITENQESIRLFGIIFGILVAGFVLLTIVLPAIVAGVTAVGAAIVAFFASPLVLLGLLAAGVVILWEQLKNLVTVWSGVGQQVALIISILVARFKAWALGIIEQIASVVTSIADFAVRMYNAGVDLMQGLIDGIVSMVAEIISTILGIGEDIINAISDMLGIESPSTVFKGIGQNLMKGLAEGIAKDASLVDDALMNATSGLGADVTLGAAGAGAGYGGVVYQDNRSFEVNPVEVNMDEYALERALNRMTTSIPSEFA